MKNTVAQNIQDVLRRIKEAAVKAGRDPKDIRLVAASKLIAPEKLKEAHEAGVDDFGENRIQEAKKKMEALSGLPIRWHFFGHLQTNKANAAIDMGFELIHSIDSVRLLDLLENHAAKADKSQSVLVEVKLSGEPSKHGVAEEGLFEILDASRKTPHIKIEGLMTVPPFFSKPEEARPYFARLRAARDEAVKEGFPLKHLSMGMSHDFETAIEEGATIVRIGTLIFGGRTK
ncbi:MAG: YggS family pyridoxal phosphate-dependent enzyme [Nitrospiraceae bacterium]|nr:YggS family pyridoxal phosphate-dependent enzyme [Nitrospiraceae bacterium]